MKCIFAFDKPCLSVETIFFEISTKKYIRNQLRPNKIRTSYKINVPQKSKIMHLFQNLCVTTRSLSWNYIR